MAAAAPWSVKGIDPEARAVAKDLARREGLTLGAWLNRRILEGPDEDADAPQSDALRDTVSTLADRIAAVEKRSEDAIAQLGRSVADLESRPAADVDANGLAQVSQRLDRTESYAAVLAERLSAQDARNAQSLRSMRDLSGALVERIAAGETTAQRTMEGLAAAQQKIEARLGRIEQAGGLDPDAVIPAAPDLDALREEIFGVVAATRTELAEAIDAAAQTGGGHADDSRIAALERSLSEALSRIDRTETRQKDAFRRIGEQLDQLARVAAAPRAPSSDGVDADAVREEIGAVRRHADEAVQRLGADVAQLGRSLSERVDQGEKRAAAALEQAGERVVEAMERLDAQRDEQTRLTLEETRRSLESRLQDSEKRTSERLEQALENVHHKLEIARSEAHDALSPVQRAMNALALRLEAIEQRRAAAPESETAEPTETPDEPGPPENVVVEEAEGAAEPDADTALEPAPDAADAQADPSDTHDTSEESDPIAQRDAFVVEDEEETITAANVAERLLKLAPSGVGPDLEAPKRFDPREESGARNRGKLMLIGSSLVGFLAAGAAGVVLMMERGGPSEAEARDPVVTAAAPSPAEAAAAASVAGPVTLAAATEMYENGVRLLRADEPEAAFPLLRSAAQAGIADAQYRYAKMLESGDAGAPDPEAALRWTLAAAQQGHLRAMHNAGVIYATAAAGEQDFNAAARWFSLAARGGFRDAQFNLALLHEQGLGVPQDAGKAYEWLLIAADAGDDGARTRAAELRRELDPEVRRSAEAAAESFRAAPPDSSGQGRYAEEAAVQPLYTAHSGVVLAASLP